MSKYYYLGSQQELNPLYRFTITLHDEDGQPAYTITGNLQNDFNVSGGNSYDEQGAHIESVIGKTRLGATALNMKNLGQTVASAGMGANKFLTQIGSQLTWQGSKSSALNLETTFVCLKAGDPKEDVTERVNTLMRAVYPELNESSNGIFFKPPMGYSTKVVNGKSNSPLSGRSVATNSGKVSLTIGNWFHAPQLVIEDVQFSYSREMNRLGKPVYAIGSVALRPYRTVTYEEFRKWFL
jgi:hypothetical protein